MRWVKTLTYFNRPIYVCLQDSYVSGNILHQGVWDSNLSQYLANSLKPDDVFLDVGANVGFFSLLAAHRFEVLNGSGRVIAVEANPVVQPYLMSSVVESGLEQRIRVLPYAASDTISLLQVNDQLRLEANLGAQNVSRCDFSAPTTGRRIVPAVRLDDVLVDLDRLNLVKMDVEGAEALAIKGMVSLLGRFRPDLLIEVNRETLGLLCDTTVAGFFELMANLGYKPHTVFGDVCPISTPDAIALVEQHMLCDFLFKHEQV